MTVASELVKKITAGFEAGGYLFLLLLQTLITRLITATKRVQKRNNNSQVTYIGITSLYRGRQKDIDFLGNEEATATVYGNSYGIPHGLHRQYTTSFHVCQHIFKYRIVAVFEKGIPWEKLQKEKTDL